MKPCSSAVAAERSNCLDSRQLRRPVRERRGISEGRDSQADEPEAGAELDAARAAREQSAVVASEIGGQHER